MSSTALGWMEVLAPADRTSSEILTPEALEFVASLHRRFNDERKAVLRLRSMRQAAIDSGTLPDFPLDSDGIRCSNWKIRQIPPDLQDRRVEITGPVGDRKMVINALNSGASTYMADFEDSQSPTWNETIQGQVNLRDVVEGTIRFVSPEGKVYALAPKHATLIVRPRGWHLLERHVVVDGEPVSASLFDFGLFLFHNAKSLLKKGSGPYFYLPKLEGRLEARLWEKVCARSEEYLNLPKGTIKVTVLIETLPAAFEMDEILYELREHVVGLNCGRWDYIFSYIKKLKSFPKFVLPDRSQVTMDQAFLAAYVDLLIKTCHRRGAYAIGGMSAYIPVRADEGANSLALQRVRADKEREVRLGHDGTWVAHPGLVPIAKEVFDSSMPGPNQLHVLREDAEISREDLLKPHTGRVTEVGVKTNVRVGLRYVTSWLAGKGCVPINNLMEDAATAEISRAQLWQWAKHGTTMEDGRRITAGTLREVISSEAAALSRAVRDPDEQDRIAKAAELFSMMTTSTDFHDFLTSVAYEELLKTEAPFA